MKTRAEIATDIAALLHDCNLTAEQKGRVFTGLADDIRWQVVAQVARRMEIAEMTAARCNGERWATALGTVTTITVDKVRNRVLVAAVDHGDLVLVWEDGSAVPADSLDSITVQSQGYRRWYIAGPNRGGFALLCEPSHVAAS